MASRPVMTYYIGLHIPRLEAGEIKEACRRLSLASEESVAVQEFFYEIHRQIQQEERRTHE